MKSYVGTTGGICNVSERRSPAESGSAAASGHMARINGLGGEILRSSLTFEVPDQIALVRRFDRQFGYLDLLRPDALRHYRKAWIDDLLSNAGAGASLNDRHDTFLLRTQVRSNFGPRLELSHIYRLMPLSSLTAVRAAFALGGPSRSTEQLHREIVGRASPVLSQHRFANGEWHHLRPPPSWAKASSPPTRRKRRVDPYATRLDRPPSKDPSPAAGPLNLADHRRLAEDSGERVQLISELVTDRSNAAWELIDPEPVAEAASRYDRCRNRPEPSSWVP